jgi:hypothetical protein
MPDIIRVHIRTGLSYDHPATGFAVGPDQTLTLTRPYADGRSGDETVAVYPRGQYSRAERLPEGTPPPDNTPLVA